jgi:hypothetical protein
MFPAESINHLLSLPWGLEMELIIKRQLTFRAKGKASTLARSIDAATK